MTDMILFAMPETETAREKGSGLATGRRTFEPITLNKDEDSFDFRQTDPADDTTPVPVPTISQFAPLDPVEPVPVDDHSSGDEHEIEYDVVAGA